MSALTTRAREPSTILANLPGPIWVQCPRCSGPASVRIGDRGGQAALSCTGCGLSRHDAGSFVAARSRKATLAHWNPRCGSCGRPIPKTVRQTAVRHERSLGVRSRCKGCGHTAIYPAHALPRGRRDGHDPHFDLPLFLQEAVGRNHLWAYNREHIDMLTSWLGASLRERALTPYYMTMMARLPRWMKAASNRPKVLNALKELARRAEEARLGESTARSQIVSNAHIDCHKMRASD